MPKRFSEQEKVLIRERLLEKAQDHMTRSGVRKTSVEDLTTAVGISKGAFYLFYPSKEELFFDVLERFEAAYRTFLLNEVNRGGQSPRARVRAWLSDVFNLWLTSPLFTHIKREDYDYLFRKLPPETVQAHLRGDEEFTVQLIEAWRQAGVVIAHDPALVTSLVRALFVVSLHHAEFRQGMFVPTAEVLVELLAQYLVEGGARDD